MDKKYDIKMTLQEVPLSENDQHQGGKRHCLFFTHPITACPVILLFLHRVVMNQNWKTHQLHSVIGFLKTGCSV